MKKDYEVIKRFLENPSDEEEIFESETLIFVDWREYDEDIITYFNQKIDNKIEVKLIDNGKDHGEDIVLRRDSKELRIPYENNIMENEGNENIIKNEKNEDFANKLIKDNETPL